MVVGPKPGEPATPRHYKYDAWNRLVQVSEDDNGDPGDEVAVFAYDGRNYRIQKTDDQQVVTAYYYNENWQVLEERLDGDVERQYVWNPEYVDSLATTYTDNGTGFDQHYYLHDANYNITAVVDDAGAVVERYAYTPYGEVTYLDASFTALTTQASTIGNEHLYTGRRTDPETGLQLNRNRYYQADLGRWINRDPIGYGDGLNAYAYVRGKATGGLDPKGTFTLSDAAVNFKLRTQGWSGLHSQSDISLQQVFDEWVSLESIDLSWVQALEKCPCSITVNCNRTRAVGGWGIGWHPDEPKYWTVRYQLVNPDPTKWEDPIVPTAAEMALHPGAKFSMRSLVAGGHYNQCT